MNDSHLSVSDQIQPTVPANKAALTAQIQKLLVACCGRVIHDPYSFMRGNTA
jgi:hypothetical protein